MTDIDTKELRRLMDAATPGPVKWWTSNSWRRLRRDDRGIAQSIAEPYVARDGHPDLDIKQADMDFIAALWNSAPAILSEADEAARLRELVCRVIPLIEMEREALFAGHSCGGRLVVEDEADELASGDIARMDAWLSEARELTAGGSDEEAQ